MKKTDKRLQKETLESNQSGKAQLIDGEVVCLKERFEAICEKVFREVLSDDETNTEDRTVQEVNLTDTEEDEERRRETGSKLAFIVTERKLFVRC